MDNPERCVTIANERYPEKNRGCSTVNVQNVSTSEYTCSLKFREDSACVWATHSRCSRSKCIVIAMVIKPSIRNIYLHGKQQLTFVTCTFLREVPLFHPKIEWRRRVSTPWNLNRHFSKPCSIQIMNFVNHDTVLYQKFHLQSKKAVSIRSTRFKGVSKRSVLFTTQELNFLQTKATNHTISIKY